VSFYFSNQKRKVGMESRLSACKANAIDPSPQRMEAGENVFQWNGSILLGVKNKGMVVTIRTAEITEGKEKHRAEFSRPIQKGGL
jgi:hypothetical protein